MIIYSRPVGSSLPFCLHLLGTLQVLPGSNFLPTMPSPWVSHQYLEALSTWEAAGHADLGIRQLIFIFLPSLHCQFPVLSLVLQQTTGRDLFSLTTFTPWGQTQLSFFLRTLSDCPPPNTHHLPPFQTIFYSFLSVPNTKNQILPWTPTDHMWQGLRHSTRQPTTTTLFRSRDGNRKQAMEHLPSKKTRPDSNTQNCNHPKSRYLGTRAKTQFHSVQWYCVFLPEPR